MIFQRKEYMEIKVNPLHGLVSNARKKVPRPKWMCRHPNAVLIDPVDPTYRCAICNPTMGTIHIIPSVRTSKTSPKKVAVSPPADASKDEPNDSPLGFKPSKE